MFLPTQRCFGIAAVFVGLAGCGFHGNRGVFVFDVGTGNATQVAETTEAGVTPEALWSQTSTDLLVHDDRALRVMTRAGEVRRTIELRTAARDSLVVLGNRYAYISAGASVDLETGALIAGELTGGRGRELLPSAALPRFLPGGRRLLATQVKGPGVTRTRKVVVPFEGGRPKPYRKDDAADIWLADGRRVRVVAHGHRTDIELREGSRRRTLVRDSRSSLLAASPDGRSLAIAGPIEGDISYQLYVLSLDGGPAQKITTGAFSGIAWSPDGRRLAAATPDGEVVILDRDGGNRRRLALFDDRVARNVSWSPDASAIAVTVDEIERGD